jgi:hypothetical protein
MGFRTDNPLDAALCAICGACTDCAKFTIMTLAPIGRVWCACDVAQRERDAYQWESSWAFSRLGPKAQPAGSGASLVQQKERKREREVEAHARSSSRTSMKP